MISFILMGLILFVVLIVFYQVFKIQKNLSDQSIFLNEVKGSNQKLETNLHENSQLLKDFQTITKDASEELKAYKEGYDLVKSRGMVLNLINLMEFTKSALEKCKDSDEKSKNYLNAIKDKIEIFLNNFGVEEYLPEVGENIDQTGCVVKETETTDRPDKIDTILQVLKPGFMMSLDEADQIIIKEAEVKAYVKK